MAKKLNIGGVEILDIESLATKAGMNTAISAALSGIFLIVPNVSAITSPGKIYLILKKTPEGEEDYYDEYLYVEGKAEHIGSTKLDLSGYAKTTAMTSAIATAKTEAINTAATTAQAKADAAKTAAITAAATDAQSKADAAKTAAISTAATDAQSKADTAKTAAISAAATDAQGKANTAKSEAISAAASDATTKANNAKSSAVSDAKSYADNTFAQVVTLTQAEYDALGAKNTKTIYVIN